MTKPTPESQLFKHRANAKGVKYEDLPANVKAAFDELVAIGAPVMMNDWGGHFNISGESNYDGMVWADYYNEYELESLDCFGVAKSINKILKKHKLWCEWYNAGVLCVYLLDE